MNPLAPIVAGIDFSAASPVVLEHAIKLALAGGRRLIAVHVLDDSKLKAWSEATGQELPATRAKDEARERLERLVTSHDSLLPVEMEIPVGRPFVELAELVKKEKAELLVLNAHDLNKKRLGTVASRCVRVVPADVMLLRDWQGRFFRKVLACVDFSDTSRIALQKAISAAAAHDAELEIVHVLFPPGRDPWGRAMTEALETGHEYDEKIRAAVRAKLDAFLGSFAAELEKVRHKTLLLESEDPAAAISAHVVSESIDLTVLGTQGRTWLGSLILGSNAERILHDSPTSILLVRLRD